MPSISKKTNDRGAIFWIISFFQVLAGLALFGLFFKYVSWVFAYQMSNLDIFTNPPAAPEWAKSFSVNHGTYTFFEDSPQENPIKRYSIIAIFGCLWLFLVTTALKFTHKENGSNS